MGLLDDAIREHLELKRRRGADPGEIALQERAALEPVYRSEDAAAEGPEPAGEPTEIHSDARAGGDLDGSDSHDAPEELELREDAAGEAPVSLTNEATHADRAADPGSPQGDPLGSSHPGLTAQETAEIDMEAVLAAEDEHDGPQGDPLGTEAIGAAWEFPGDPAEEDPPKPIPGQERMSFE